MKRWWAALVRWWTTAPCHNNPWSCSGSVRVVRGTRVSIYCDRCLSGMELPAVSHLEEE